MLDPIIFSPNCLYQLGPKLKKKHENSPEPRAASRPYLIFSPPPPPPPLPPLPLLPPPPMTAMAGGGLSSGGGRAAERRSGPASGVAWDGRGARDVVPLRDPARGDRQRRRAAAVVL